MVVWGGGRERRRELQCVGGCYCGGSTCIVCSVQSIEPHEKINSLLLPCSRVVPLYCRMSLILS